MWFEREGNQNGVSEEIRALPQRPDLTAASAAIPARIFHGMLDTDSGGSVPARVRDWVSNLGGEVRYIWESAADKEELIAPGRNAGVTLFLLENVDHEMKSWYPTEVFREEALRWLVGK